MTTEEFIKKARKVHGDKYDYSKVEYVNTATKVCIICPVHGEFWQTPNCHLSGCGCPTCSRKNYHREKYSTEEFIEKARKIHGNKYDYSKVDYVNNHTKVCLICPEHGEFWQEPKDHLKGRGCPKCLHPNANMTREEFIEKATQIHGHKYDYSKVEFVNMSTKVCIICPVHGEFWQCPTEHLRGCGCYKCKMLKSWNTRGRKTTEEWIEEAKKVHGDKYDYSKVEYKGTKEKVCIICPEHGEFWQTAGGHLSGNGCKKCVGLNKPTTEEWIERVKLIHGNKYDYSKLEYVNAKTKVCIICPEHGEFWQMPSVHLIGGGCPQCDMSHLENHIYMMLKDKEVNFISESNINGLLGRMRVDFYLPDKKLVIECQGGQHFYGGFDRNNKEHAEKIHLQVLARDIRKYNILKENGIEIIYFCGKEDMSDNIFENPKFQNMYNRGNTFSNKDKMYDFIMKKLN